MAKFPKSHILTAKNDFDELVQQGLKTSVYPLFIRYTKNQNTPELGVAFVVPKRNIRLAVNRNRIKRQMKEAYRVNNGAKLLEGYRVLFIYTGKKKLPYAKIEEAFLSFFDKIKNEKV